MSASAESLAAAASLDTVGDEDLFSLLIRYGLYVGALFQFVCISAAVLMAADDGSMDTGEVTEPGTRTRLHKIRKLEKKKRR
ncbi:protein anon-73B1 [Drosophila kikkawai]|uniref:Protein anon-73B1 n=1 Tax=Drosophila kikkawai TaxID=30033 RepID=A0A6P4J3P4_DROKI|nr:protein anon-73B1 [Drosophila kikkawai]KAH8322656.1 hypothetical protein KR059_002628 [Drosophila kikkawai]